MKGYVINKSSSWIHAMKRSVGPGGKVPLKELFEQYGAKHGLREGKEFIDWLRTVKLNDSSRWSIVSEETVVEDNTVNNVEEVKSADSIAPFVGTKLDVSDVVGLSVRQARDVVPKITDLNLLRYSYQEANQLSSKESLCRIIRKRIQELQVAR